MSVVEKFVLLIFALSALLLAGLVVRHNAIGTGSTARLPAPVLITKMPRNFSLVDEKRDFQGERKAALTLIEFADYQCPPCRSLQKRLPEILRRHQKDLRFTFRNLPLRDIHPYAYQAAVVAEAMPQQGKFWSAHDALMQVDTLNDQAIMKISHQPDVDPVALHKALSTTAKEAVKTDIRLAEKWEVDATPIFYLICPDHRIYHLSSPEQVDLLTNTPAARSGLNREAAKDK